LGNVVTPVPVLLAGLIFTLAGSHWFDGAHTVGLILVVAGAVGIALPLLAFAGLFAFIRRR
jgi:hypothetical protein